MNSPLASINRERVVNVLNGWVMLPVVLVLFFGAIALFVYSIVAGISDLGHPVWSLFVIAILVEIAAILMFPGFFALQPNQARVLVLFGGYKGTVREPGFHWGNPFYSNGPNRPGALMRAALEANAAGKPGMVAQEFKKLPRFKFSLRTRNFNSEKLKVNDKRGNPIEIAAVVVWRVQDTAQAMFDVDDYENYVRVQSESALAAPGQRLCLRPRRGTRGDAAQRDGRGVPGAAAGIAGAAGQGRRAVEEARLTHLAYAPEIAQAMLRRQQAEAVIAARQKIVHGAVSMVEMALQGTGGQARGAPG